MKDFLGFAITNARAEFKTIKITDVTDSNTWGTERDASASPSWEPLSETCVWDPPISEFVAPEKLPPPLLLPDGCIPLAEGLKQQRQAIAELQQMRPIVIVPLRVICAWCKKLLQEGAPNAATSHSICPDCLVTLNAEDRTCER